MFLFKLQLLQELLFLYDYSPRAFDLRHFDVGREGSEVEVVLNLLELQFGLKGVEDCHHFASLQYIVF